MSEQSNVIDELRAILTASVGGPSQTGRASEKEMHRFAYAVDDLNALYFDEDYARSHDLPGVIAPPLYVLASTHQDVPLDCLQEDGIASSDAQSAMYKHFKRVVAGGTEYEFFQHIRPGDVLTAERAVGRIFQKEGRSGPLTFVENVSTWKNQNGEKVATQTFTAIYRP